VPTDMDLDRLRAERPEIFLASDERELVAGFEEPLEEVREAFLEAIPALLAIYAKKRRALREGSQALWKEVLEEEAALVGGVSEPLT
jgi:hypothetical protein